MAAGKAPAMKKPSSSFGTRAWRLLRLAVLWARKEGGVAAHGLRLLRTLRRHGHGLAGLRLRGGDRDRGRLRHGEREYSIDETPAFRFRTPSARVLRLIPCIAPDTPGLYGGDDDRYFFAAAATREMDDEEGAGYYGYDDNPRSARDVEEEDEEDELSCCGGDDEQLLDRVVAEACRSSTAGSVAGEDAGVDVKAEEFIARFYAQMKLQRQISWLQYNEMMERSIS